MVVCPFCGSTQVYAATAENRCLRCGVRWPVRAESVVEIDYAFTLSKTEAASVARYARGGSTTNTDKRIHDILLKKSSVFWRRRKPRCKARKPIAWRTCLDRFTH